MIMLSGGVPGWGAGRLSWTLLFKDPSFSQTCTFSHPVFYYLTCGSSVAGAFCGFCFWEVRWFNTYDNVVRGSPGVGGRPSLLDSLV